MAARTTLARVEESCRELRREGQRITFTTVAERAGLSRTSLYRDSGLRAVIEEHRATDNDPRTLSELKSEIAHLRTAVEALAKMVRSHETQLRRLPPTQSARRRAN